LTGAFLRKFRLQAILAARLNLRAKILLSSGIITFYSSSAWCGMRVYCPSLFPQDDKCVFSFSVISVIVFLSGTMARHSPLAGLLIDQQAFIN
jgi:hypothetical protein